ncbi:M13 family metallopeptidase [Undibacterium squillarum]|uniref:Peptidase M13 n=1 Tax=Undibacterium squillarum TaxID=1131567 RepID=A0ABQ2XZ80_9BURK|nr:M13 family metallopeptidase [Undibacterium squillarum]GGX43458.1 peptidase M13 [Undibacterium squillarum]
MTNKPLLLSTLSAALLTLWTPSLQAQSSATAAQTAASTVSGVVRDQMDAAVRPQDDFYRHAQGGWLKATEIPADRSDWGGFIQARELVQQQLKAIVEQAAANAASTKGSNAQKIGDLYNSFMNTGKLAELGLQPLQADLKAIAALKDKKQLAALFAQMQQAGVRTPFAAAVEQDARQSSAYLLVLSQAGLGLPNRDYYLKQDDARMTQARAAYLQYVQTLLSQSGDKAAEQHAAQVLELETAIAKAQWSNVENRDPVKVYNKLSVTELQKLTPSIQWQAWLKAQHAGVTIKEVQVMQPSYLQGLQQIIGQFSTEVWQAYLTTQLLDAYAPYLTDAYTDAHFAFRGKVLSGIERNRSREKRGVELTDQMLGEAVGKLYVENHFPAERKARVRKMVDYFLKAFDQSIDTLDWMSEETRKQAKIKLSKISVKVGYPDQWRDYSSLQIKADDLIGNIRRIRAADHAREIAHLGKPVERSVWHMTPQTVNAYYSPEMNEIVFPAARLQAPLVNPQADDAFNYGALGISIGHEISHAFDDSGSQYDGDGNLRNWWTEQDRQKFEQRTGILVEQYNKYSPVAGYFLNGKLTLGENIADNAGLVMAIKAYHLSLEGKPAPVIDGYSAEQRLFFGLAQARRFKARESRAIMLVKTDPHSPGEFRVNGSLRNTPEFYSAFDVKPGDNMYLPPEQRVKLW